MNIIRTMRLQDRIPGARVSKIDPALIGNLAVRLKLGLRATNFPRLRERAGLTLSEAQALLKVDRRTIYRYERGETKPE